MCSRVSPANEVCPRKVHSLGVYTHDRLFAQWRCHEQQSAPSHSEQCSPGPDIIYFLALWCLAACPFSSTTITSIPLSPVFSGKWVVAAWYCDWPALTSKSCFLPSGKANCPLASVRNTATVAGWLCMTDFSCGP